MTSQARDQTSEVEDGSLLISWLRLRHTLFITLTGQMTQRVVCGEFRLLSRVQGGANIPQQLLVLGASTCVS